MTAEERRELMPDATKMMAEGFFADFRKEFRGEIDALRIVEGEHVFEWERT